MGVGGYASGPVVLVAWLMRIPTAVQEQNAIAGFTNRWLGKLVQAAFTAFPEAARHFRRSKVYQLGNPIRRSLLENFMRPDVEHAEPRVLVFGGSQGAHALNMRVIESLPHLADLRERIHITHQTGARDREYVEKGYRAVGFRPDVREFITDMSAAYAESDLVVCRAGATTLAELTVCKKPAILVPFPAAADNHQVKNARSLVDAGAAVMIEEKDLTGEVLAHEMRRILFSLGGPREHGPLRRPDGQPPGRQGDRRRLRRPGAAQVGDDHGARGGAPSEAGAAAGSGVVRRAVNSPNVDSCVVLGLVLPCFAAQSVHASRSTIHVQVSSTR